MSAAPPLRFLGVVVGGWACARAAFLAPEWLSAEVEASEVPVDRPLKLAPETVAEPQMAALPIGQPEAEIAPEPARIAVSAAKNAGPPPPARLAMNMASGQLAVARSEPAAMASAEAPSLTSDPALAVSQPMAVVLQGAQSRFAVSGWAIVRQGTGSALATAGTLGGSQAGLRATYRLNPSLALSARLSSPLEGEGAEAAIGIEWQPVAKLPVKLLAERRQAIGDEGRSGFALLAHGGVSGVKVAGPVEAEAYAQAGVVGARERELFADGAVKLNVPVTDGVSVGAGAWGAAQADVGRLDVGPHVTLTLPGGSAHVRVAAEYRVRIAGDAEPGSGPAITVATSF